MEHYIGVLKKYAVFSGRANRMEFWMFMLFSILISIALNAIDNYVVPVEALRDIGILGAIYSLAVLIPSIAVAVRRLHDINRSAWWLLVLLIPVLGLVIMIVFCLLESTPGDNKYGPNPNGISTSTPSNTGSPASNPPTINPSI